MQPQVREERTGWRDEAISGRHRKWGWDCPAIDIDFLALEYDKGKPVAIIEYKNERAQDICATHPSYQAIIALGDAASIPVFVVRYSSAFTWFTVIPLNDPAKKWVPIRDDKISEREYVTLLYRIRGYTPPNSLWDSLYVDV